MMQSATKRYQEEPRVEAGGEMKGVVLIIVCYFYGMLLFLLFGAVTKIGQLVFRKVQNKVRDMTFWSVEKKSSKYDYNHNVRQADKHVWVGQR